MSTLIDVSAAAHRLLAADDVLILTHQYPDGDTLGSGFALCRALRQKGKRARVVCGDVIPEKYDFLMEGLDDESFEPQFICAVDVADKALLGSLCEPYGDRVDLCIDHHASNVQYASELLLKADYAAAAMAVTEVLKAMDVVFDQAIAEAIYTGIATDSGCFKYSNADAYTHRMAAEMLDHGVRFEMINRTMFDIKSRARVALEREALAGMRFFYGGRVAVMPITLGMVENSGARENDMEGLAPIPRQIEGVWVGVMLREKADGSYKVSVRTGNHADASAICQPLGGGGHVRAAGCTLDGPLDAAIERMLQMIADTIPRVQEKPRQATR
ncbi:MAG: bifunctional oligoribonuclease/PAP phosphatase NrnA [Clostridia bacterium]|nr:bifunctional oligoribonuclease/PAP phosphatase NrnA [Clostridia bacterium]